MSEHIIVVNASESFLRLMDALLSSEGYKVTLLPESMAAYETIQKDPPALIIIDTWLESRDAGWSIIQVLKLDQRTASIPIIICTSDIEEYEKRTQDVYRVPGVEAITKPFDPDTLVALVRQMLAARA